MNHAEIEELLGVYALDAVDDEERAQVELHLAGCPRCRAEVAEHREVAALLAHGGSPAPEGVWDRIVGALEEAPPKLRLEVGPVTTVEPGPVAVAPVVPLDQRRGRRVGWVAAAAGVAAATLVAVLSYEVVQQRREIDRIEAALSYAAVGEAIADPASREAMLVSADGAVSVRAIATDTGQGYLLTAGLPELTGGRIYQLWGLTGGEAISLGVVGGDSTVVAFAIDDHFDGLAITREVAPVAASDNAPIVVGELS